jgi:hypothetical protein
MVLTVATEAIEGVGDVAPLRVAIDGPRRDDGALEVDLTPGRVLALTVRTPGAMAIRLFSRSERVVRWKATMGNCLWVLYGLVVVMKAVKEASRLL